MVFPCLHETAHQYNVALLTMYNPPRRLRFSDSLLLAVPQTHNLWGDRSFTNAGPSLWNELPLHSRSIPPITDFKVALKSHFFVN